MNDTCQFCHVTHRVIVPTVHLNGTAAEDLYEQLSAAVDAAHEADAKMCLAAPNGRDYYPQGDSALRIVMHEHERRCSNLNQILTELEEMRDHVQSVINFKNAAREARR